MTQRERLDELAGWIMRTQRLPRPEANELDLHEEYQLYHRLLNQIEDDKVREAMEHIAEHRTRVRKP
jgi:hypothetical protein